LFGWGDELTENGKDVEFTSHSDHIWVYNPKHERYKEGNVTEYTFTAEAGMYVVVDDAFSRVVFTPYAGKQSLGFK
jgi:copper(I)-binding protein